MSSACTNTACGPRWSTSREPAPSIRAASIRVTSILATSILMARRRKFVGPIEAVDGGWQVNLDTGERQLIIRLMGELRALITGPDDNELLLRLFPAAYTDDEEKEAEYQRLMREELVASRLASIEMVERTLDPDRRELLDEGETLAFMQSLNAIRLVLGTMLDITDDDAADADEEGQSGDSPEHHLYDFLSWLLEWTVRSLSPS